MEKPKLYLIPTTHLKPIVKDKIVLFKYTEEPQEPIEDLNNILVIKNNEEPKVVFTDSKVIIKKEEIENYYFSNDNLMNFLDTNKYYIDILSDYIYNQTKKEKTYKKQET